MYFTVNSTPTQRHNGKLFGNSQEWDVSLLSLIASEFIARSSVARSLPDTRNMLDQMGQ